MSLLIWLVFLSRWHGIRFVWFLIAANEDASTESFFSCPLTLCSACITAVILRCSSFPWTRRVDTVSSRCWLVVIFVCFCSVITLSFSGFRSSVWSGLSAVGVHHISVTVHTSPHHLQSPSTLALQHLLQVRAGMAALRVTVSPWHQTVQTPSVWCDVWPYQRPDK